MLAINPQYITDNIGKKIHYPKLMNPIIRQFSMPLNH
jgi:hypothetical protein